MTLLHFDGMDAYAANGDMGLEYSGSPAINTTLGRFGGGAFIGGANTIFKNLGVGDTNTDLWFGGAHFPNGSISNGCIVDVVSGAGNIELSFLLDDGNNNISVWRSWDNIFGTVTRGATAIGTSAVLAGIRSIWSWWDFHVVFSSGTSGTIEVWRNGIQVINLTGIKTCINAVTGYSGIRWGASHDQTTSTTDRRWDDIYIKTGASGRLGDSRVYTLVPASDAGPNVGTPSTGTSHFAMVNEVQPNLTNYNSVTGTSGNHEMYGVTALPSANTVYGVRSSAFAAKSDAAEVLFAGVVKSGTTEVVGTTQGAFVGANQKSSQLLELDPNTSAAWTQTTVNAMLIGAKVP